MQIRFLESIDGYRPGVIYNLTVREALRYIQRGVAEPCQVENCALPRSVSRCHTAEQR